MEYAATNGPTRYLTFRVARTDFAIEAAHVRGILPLEELIPVPAARQAAGAPDSGNGTGNDSGNAAGGLAGVASFQSRALAVVDLRARLQLPRAASGRQPKIVVAELPGGRLTGFIADRVSDVVVYRGRNLRNGVLHGLGRPRKVMKLDVLEAGDEAARRMVFGR